ncbi:MAG: glutamate synthase-related protein [Desulfosalsimonadaceae bacterium]|nr:glutamate synthase-related protein [Desulfosalsimonadaceae bacterium]
MPEKYHIKTTPVPPRLPRIGKYGIVDWREDCARCHNCVKKACVYDRHRQESNYIRTLKYSNFLFFECMGCFYCVQNCTKELLCLTINSEYEQLGNHYWTPEIIQTTWQQAETASVPVSGAGYRGKFAGPGFDSMWTDMSEIVRPTRDGIHGREYISTSVDIGRKPAHLSFENGKITSDVPEIMDIPIPLIIDMNPPEFTLPQLEPFILEAVKMTDIIAIIDSGKWATLGNEKQRQNMDQYLPNIAFHLNPDAPEIPVEVLKKTRLVEIPDSETSMELRAALKQAVPGIVVAIRVVLNAKGAARAIELVAQGADVIHVVADFNGNEIGVKKPRFIKDMIREIHTSLIKSGQRDQVTLISGGGIALPEHMAKALLCGTDVVSTHLPLMLALECRLCNECKPGMSCPAGLEDVGFDYGAGRMRNLIAAWYLQLIELMGAMGMREARRLRGDVGRAMFFEEMEEEIFGTLFGTRKQA